MNIVRREDGRKSMRAAEGGTLDSLALSYLFGAFFRSGSFVRRASATSSVVSSRAARIILGRLTLVLRIMALMSSLSLRLLSLGRVAFTIRSLASMRDSGV